MNCEQVEAILLDLDREDSANIAERAAASAHLAHCSRCAGLQESWQAAREELRALREETLAARAPARVEMRLRQEFRMQHRTRISRRSAAIAAWALAAAAVLVVAVSVRNWQQSQHLNPAQQPSTSIPATEQSTSARTSSGGLSGIDDSGEFTPLPGSTLDDTEEAAILRVRMQRGSLAALGLPVNEQRASEWIQVDMLVGNDGLPQAVRLAQEQEED